MGLEGVSGGSDCDGFLKTATVVDHLETGAFEIGGDEKFLTLRESLG